MARRIEQCVRDVFEKQFAGRVIPYQEARGMVTLERRVVDELVRAFCPEDCL